MTIDYDLLFCIIISSSTISDILYSVGTPFVFGSGIFTSCGYQRERGGA